MGLSIHYDFNAGIRSTVEILNILKSLRSHAQRLAFYEVDSQITHLRQEDLSSENPSAFLFLVDSRIDPSTFERRTPEQIIGFTALPRAGSESISIFLAQYTESNDWTASGHCKTMFAGRSKYGGSANFVLAHRMVVELLSQAQKLGIVESVFDESSYWEERDLLCLVDKDELLTLSDAVLNQTGNMPPDFVASLLGQIKLAIK